MFIVDTPDEPAVDVSEKLSDVLRSAVVESFVLGSVQPGRERLI